MKNLDISPRQNAVDSRVHVEKYTFESKKMKKQDWRDDMDAEQFATSLLENSEIRQEFLRDFYARISDDASDIWLIPRNTGIPQGTPQR